MGRKGKITVGVIVSLAALILGRMLLAFKLPPVVIRAEAIPGLQIAGIKITNALITALVVDVILVVLSIIGTRKMKEIPSGLQNILEWIIETINNLSLTVAGAKWAPKFFAITTTIFLYVLVSNWFGLIPGLAAFGVCSSEAEHAWLAPANAYAATMTSDASWQSGKQDSGAEERRLLGCKPGEIIVPLFRSPSTDLNNNFALAIFSVVMTQVFGIMALGVGYFWKFINLKGIIKAFTLDDQGQRKSLKVSVTTFLFGCIDLFVGLLETISEFAKVISFSFRLFGNIFAGEVMLLVLSSLLPLLLTLPFLGLELFVGLIQAFIFYILTLAFFTIATASHGGEAH